MLKKLFLLLNKIVKSPLGFILLASLVSYGLMAFIHPDWLVRNQMSFLWQHDTEIPYQNTFTLISFYQQGGIQLWNRYDQMSYVFAHLTTGLYTLTHIFLAFIYILFSPLIKYPGEAFHAWYSIGFHGFTIFLRTFGGYLLLRRFTTHRGVIFAALIYLNSFLSVPMYFGMDTNNIFSLLPLLLYFLLKF
ncbi:MAG: hypothetical protein WC552_05950, partial [Candidatus Omnitrophota bacterium]